MASPSIGIDVAQFLVHDDGFVPKSRYLSKEFLALESELLWKRVWQIACREEEIATVGAFSEYVIGDQSVIVLRTADKRIEAFHNACLHRGTRLVAGNGTLDATTIRCPYHGWKYSLDGTLTEVVDRDDFPDNAFANRQGLAPVRCETFGGFVFVTLAEDSESLLDFLAPLPALLAPYRLDQMRFRSYRSTVLPANWKAVVDAFNEGYHVQGAHPQILAWTDDVSIAYEQFETHAHYGRLPGARRELRPSPRLGLASGEYDEGEILASLVAGLGGAFLGDEQALVAEVRAAAATSGGSMLGLFQSRRRALMVSRGFDVSAFTDDALTSADDVFWFPNVVGPIYPGSTILFRVRPNGIDPDSSIQDTWVLQWPEPGAERRELQRRFTDDWHDRSWGEITEQDYRNLERVQVGMKSDGFSGLRLNPRQEANVLHMHRVIDRYLQRSMDL